VGAKSSHLPEHPGTKAINAIGEDREYRGACCTLRVCFASFRSSSGCARLQGPHPLVIYPPSKGHEHLRPGFRNHAHSRLG
jgi:hypothetical protein